MKSKEEILWESARKYFDPTIVEGQICPKCGSNDIIFVAYGLVDPDDFDREVLLGGCIIGEDSPNLICKKCEHQWISE